MTTRMSLFVRVTKATPSGTEERGIMKFNGRHIEPGCRWSSGRGHWISLYLVLEALDAGWDDQQARLMADTYGERYYSPDWPQSEQWPDIVDDAMEYLNSKTEGGRWEWQDGEVFLVEDEEIRWWKGSIFHSELDGGQTVWVPSRAMADAGWPDVYSFGSTTTEEDRTKFLLDREGDAYERFDSLLEGPCPGCGADWEDANPGRLLLHDEGCRYLLWLEAVAS